MTDKTTQAAECLSHLTAELDTTSDENEKEFFGWCVLDKYGVSRHVIPARQHFFGCINTRDTLEESSQVLEEFDRDCAGLAPHKICKLYISV
jgi:predicted 3-demethylubiquinone-9 3-methyltransferase (glyoxalase superfamily)